MVEEPVYMAPQGERKSRGWHGHREIDKEDFETKLNITSTTLNVTQEVVFF